eukprot:TRINITY_DN22624_c0_g1_i3.p1 TRINITY_DN22624_c0_g1~~TRINITY_DN22624_c0_g1_i3.p1  ORF type:complete len:422 (+),score=90.50 TRINITY_DN22624_c0_g1_i3:81-1346(+)
MPSTLLAAAMTPLPAEELTEKRHKWLSSLRAIGGSDSATHAVKCGEEALKSLAERLASERQSAEKMLESAGLRSKRGRGDKSVGAEAIGRLWLAALEECGRDFVEQCSAIVEVCFGAEAPPRLSQRLLGFAVKLAESLGRTGPFLAALEIELAMVGDRLLQLESLYTAAVKHTEAVAFDSAANHTKAEEAERAREEHRREAKEAQEALMAENKDLRRDLRVAVQQRKTAEHQLQELRREHYTARQHQQHQRSTLKSPRSAVQRMSSPAVSLRPSPLAALHQSTPRSGQSFLDGHTTTTSAMIEESEDGRLEMPEPAGGKPKPLEGSGSDTSEHRTPRQGGEEETLLGDTPSASGASGPKGRICGTRGALLPCRAYAYEPNRRQREKVRPYYSTVNSTPGKDTGCPWTRSHSHKNQFQAALI